LFNCNNLEQHGWQLVNSWPHNIVHACMSISTCNNLCVFSRVDCLSLQQLWYYFSNCVYPNPPCQLSLWGETGAPGENPRLSAEHWPTLLTWHLLYTKPSASTYFDFLFQTFPRIILLRIHMDNLEITEIRIHRWLLKILHADWLPLGWL
jgi:hypothetical protein